MIRAAHETPSQAAPRAGFDTGQTLTTRERWRILHEQIAAGQEPCFRSDRRYQCGDLDCRWRARCQSMRAQWCR